MCPKRERGRAAKTEREGEATQHDCVCSVLAGACLPFDPHLAPLSRLRQCHGSKSKGVIKDPEELNPQGGQDVLVTRYAKPEDALVNKDAIFLEAIGSMSRLTESIKQHFAVIYVLFFPRPPPPTSMSQVHFLC